MVQSGRFLLEGSVAWPQGKLTGPQGKETASSDGCWFPLGLGNRVNCSSLRLLLVVVPHVAGPTHFDQATQVAKHGKALASGEFSLQMWVRLQVASPQLTLNFLGKLF